MPSRNTLLAMSRAMELDITDSCSNINVLKQLFRPIIRSSKDLYRGQVDILERADNASLLTIPMIIS